MQSNKSQLRRDGFTLIEMLVVITIIAILASLLVPTLAMAVRKARESAIAKEVHDLAAAMHEFKNQMGAYPPDLSDPNQNRRRTDFVRWLNSATNNKHRETQAALFAVADNITPSEALVFWLRETKKNVELPLTAGPGSDPRVLFDFKEDRLIPDSDGDNIPQGYLPPYGADVPYVYFSHLTYGVTSGVDGTTIGGQGVAFPYKSDVPGIGFGSFQAKDTFQIICAGYDGDFGANSRDKGYPNGTNMSPEDFDNLANIAESRLDDEID